MPSCPYTRPRVSDFRPTSTTSLYRSVMHICLSIHSKTRSYNTWVYYNSKKQFHCWSKEIFTSDIKTGQDSNGPIYIIQSENYGQGPYYPRRLQYFNINCPNDGTIHSITTDLEEQSELTVSLSSLKYCVDYVHVNYKKSQSLCELCGNQTVKSQGCEELFEQGLTVTFRSSRLNNYNGFKMEVICYSANEQNLPGCIQTLAAQESKMNSQDDSNYYYYSTVNHHCV